jgi:DNA-binding NarL/FixJ family response regulator
LPEEIFARALDLGGQVEDHRSTIYELARQRRQAVAELLAAGLTKRRIADALGIHHTRVGQLERLTKP